MMIETWQTDTFLLTWQYKAFAETCDYVRNTRKIGLVHGTAGAGKSTAARRYVTEQEPLSSNGQSPVFYIELEQTDKTDRAFYNSLVAALSRRPPENVSAKVAANEAKRLFDKYGYQMLIVDEFHFLQDTGLEAVRTFWDKTHLPIMLITMTGFTGMLHKAKHLQLESRICRVLTFDTLQKKQIARDVLPQLPQLSHIVFSADQDDAAAIIDLLFDSTRGNFRQLTNILIQANNLIELSKQTNEHYQTHRPDKTPPPIHEFGVTIIREAIAMTRGA